MKRLTREEKWQNALADLINEMFRIAGHSVTFDDIKDRKDNWFQEWTMTVDQNAEWTEWGKRYLQKNLRIKAKDAELQMGFLSLQYGLKFSDFSTDRSE